MLILYGNGIKWKYNGNYYVASGDFKNIAAWEITIEHFSVNMAGNISELFMAIFLQLAMFEDTEIR